MNKLNGVNHSSHLKDEFRRKGALARLRVQLQSGVKNTPNGKQPLTDIDIKRINKEMAVLSSRIS